MISQLQIRLLTLGATTLLTLAALLRQGRSPSGVNAASMLNRGAGLLAFSVAADSALEHYRGDFHNRAMYIPLATSTLSLLVSLRGPHHAECCGCPLRKAVYLGSALSGITGTGFHFYNITARPGGWSWHNLLHSAPLGAPFALVLSAILGRYADELAGAPEPNGLRIAMLPADVSIALIAAFGLTGTTLEAALLHFRGAFQNPAMCLPVIVPPLAALLLIAAVMAGPGSFRLRWLSQLLLRFTTGMGWAGAGFHAIGIARRNGGWRNWRQNIQAGPPLPAPPSFTGLALAGLAAHELMDAGRA